MCWRSDALSRATAGRAAGTEELLQSTCVAFLLPVCSSLRASETLNVSHCFIVHPSQLVILCRFTILLVYADICTVISSINRSGGKCLCFCKATRLYLFYAHRHYTKQKHNIFITWKFSSAFVHFIRFGCATEAWKISQKRGKRRLSMPRAGHTRKTLSVIRYFCDVKHLLENNKTGIPAKCLHTCAANSHEQVNLPSRFSAVLAHVNHSYTGSVIRSALRCI